MQTKPIKDYEGLYEVTDDGKVFALKYTRGKSRYELKQADMGKGYMVVNLCKNGKRNNHRVHRLVATAFIQNPYKKLEVNHKNGIKHDNSVGNLEWSTRQENEIHAFQTLGKKAVRGECNGLSKLKEKEV